MFFFLRPSLNGTTRINTELFTVITVDNATEHGENPDDSWEYTVELDKIGIVTTFDGDPRPAGEVVGPSVPGHSNFQDGQAFIDNHGWKGLQEVIPAGRWRLNPWFVGVEQVALTNIEAGTVGVVVSKVGRISNDSNNLAEPGY
ncbi:hypothetical protein [Phormidesmis priestleyi]